MMAKRDYVDFQDRTHPLAYLITFRCYGTWLHGDERGSVDRRHDNRPEHIMNGFKSYATRKLREASLLSEDIKPWARHGSTPYLWTEEELRRAIDYVLNGQGDEPFR